MSVSIFVPSSHASFTCILFPHQPLLQFMYCELRGGPEWSPHYVTHGPAQKDAHSGMSHLSGVQFRLAEPLCLRDTTSSLRSLVAALVRHVPTSYTDVMLQSSESSLAAQMASRRRCKQVLNTPLVCQVRTLRPTCGE